MFSLFQEPDAKDQQRQPRKVDPLMSNVSNAHLGTEVLRVVLEPTIIVSSESRTPNLCKSQGKLLQQSEDTKKGEQIIWGSTDTTSEETKQRNHEPFLTFRGPRQDQQPSLEDDRHVHWECPYPPCADVVVEPNKSATSAKERRTDGLKKFRRRKSLRQSESWFEEIFWSRTEVQRMKRNAAKQAKGFRKTNRGTVSQIEKLFDDFCQKRSNDQHAMADDEEEMLLTFFLRDWADSDVRGLEEMVTERNMFQEGRLMAVESILAYQQQLLMNADYSLDEVATLLRARSESASRRARMFALYLALGDALVSAMNTDEFQ